MKENVEREVKLTPGEGFVMPSLGTALPTRTFLSTYHDTPELALAAHGVTFRHRVQDGGGRWQLKLPHGAHRVELEVDGPPARPPEELVVLLVALLRERELVPVARLRTRREVLRTAEAEIVDDQVAVLDGQRVVRRFRELEVELLDGDDAALERLAGTLIAAGAVRDTRPPKLFQALDLAPPTLRTKLRRDEDPVRALGIELADQYHRLLAHDPGTRLGADAEDLHQLRVATRRLRAFLRVGRPLIDRSWADELRAELGWLGSALGPARDLDVLTAYLAGELQALDAADAGASLLGDLERERSAARAAAVAAMSTDRYLALLDRVEQAGEPPSSGTSRPLAELWARQWKRTRKVFKKLGDHPPDDVLHDARISVKRARYAAELAAHELGKPGAKFVDAAKELQDVLGDHQDAVVAEDRVHAWAAAGGDAELAGRVAERERERRAEARRAWPGAWQHLAQRGQELRG